MFENFLVVGVAKIESDNKTSYSSIQFIKALEVVSSTYC